MVRIADKCPPKTTPLLPMHCDEIMSVISDASYATKPVTPKTSADRRDNQPPPVIPAEDQRADRVQLEQTFSAFPAAQTNDTSAPQDRRAASSGSADKGRTSALGNSLRHEVSPGRDALGQHGKHEPDSIGSNDGVSVLPDWAQPSLRTSPTNASHDESASESTASSGALGTYSTRELLERWRSTTGDDHREIESQLASRGLKHLSLALVEQYLSENAEDRSRVVDTVLKTQGADVRPWLFLLAEDDDADVRLTAVTVMASSTDRALIEKAWQISIRDPDPRIADLSAHLRDRRAETLLR
jgi:hypothetical protein